MSEWWTYRPSDFLLYSPRTYFRLYALLNAELWPAHLVTLACGLALLVVLWLQPRRASAIAGTLLAGCWLGVAWAFHWQRYASINWAATWFAAAFGLQALLLLAWAAAGQGPPGRSAGGLARAVGIGLLGVAVLAHPLWAGLAGRPWMQAEVFGLAPDPTAVATLGVLLALQPRPGAGGSHFARLLWRLLWPLPLLWCGLSGLLQWTMQAPGAWLLPAAAAGALLAAATGRRAAGPTAP